MPSRIALISAAASGQGKTTVVAALARRWRNEGKRVRVFKTGADFLDPMLLQVASGAPVSNLDLWINGEAACRRALADAASDADIVLIEGVMGLYDGSPSSADLARAFHVPVIAVIDASALAQTAGALAMGLRDYGPVRLAGVIANRVAGPAHAAMVAASLRDIPLLGSLTAQDAALPERHLGLVPATELPDLDARLERLAQDLSLDASIWQALPEVRIEAAATTAPAPSLRGKTIAVAQDAAFCFLYPDNLDCLRALGATLCPFSPLANEAVPAHADALYLPGGYPELHGATLAAATRWQASVRDFHARGLPIWAECGGMMALADAIVDHAAQRWPMAGLLPGEAMMQARLGGLGPQALPLPQGQLRGHAFHYSRLETALEPATHTLAHPSGVPGAALYRVGTLAASYFHAWFPSCPPAAAALFGARQSV
ncbi:cobyrinate a,c-diamide synthase [Noviherbaspirillum pedocola]|uniref:Cobyrinate a,c-diamide synthase n=1 Tax=Noviherbaspirillum pedocola TaxID=2801341 RepID=A0A934W5V9_9BURK|nr:cobyrinate a,c-diamide synthase [Noviherbaspirillum pedocola]MBK4734395.1 cobyrinate a,c-diamide synthase [Noviherbaspirillum pedocola]